MKAVELIRQTAKVAHSKVLEQLANSLAAHLSGPFDTVNNEIEKMIFRLMDEQKKEDEHKLWCDQELKQSETSRDDKADKVAELNEKIKAGVSKSAELVEAIADAQKMVADITAHMEEATEIRKVGKEENRLAIKDSEDAQTAVSNAIAVLTEFYKSSGAVPKESWEFVQTANAGDVDLPEKPSTWESSYSGVADPKNPTGILTVLEEISKDFAEMEAETRAQEQEDQDLYDKEMSECEIEKARRSKEAEMKTQEQKRVDAKAEEMEKAKKGVQKELDAVKQYLEDLKPACVNGDSSYEDRKKARDDEIAGLKQAQGILKDAFGKQPGTFLQKRA
jgi:chromosome segregation ATPase